MKMSLSALLVAGLACFFLLDSSEAITVSANVDGLKTILERLINDNGIPGPVKAIAQDLLDLVNGVNVSGEVNIDTDMFTKILKNFITALEALLGKVDAALAPPIKKLILLAKNVLAQLPALTVTVGLQTPISLVNFFNAVAQLIPALQDLPEQSGLDALATELLGVLRTLLLVVLSVLLRVAGTVVGPIILLLAPYLGPLLAALGK